jgi:hypothetical protein
MLFMQQPKSPVSIIAISPDISDPIDPEDEWRTGVILSEVVAHLISGNNKNLGILS